MSGLLLLDTHVVHWWSAEPERLSRAAAQAVEAADELAVSGITWYELAWLAEHERIDLAVPVLSWLQQLGSQVRTLGITPAVAASAAALPSSFPGDPADRVIYATAVQHGCRLVTKDGRLRAHRSPRRITLW